MKDPRIDHAREIANAALTKGGSGASSVDLAKTILALCEVLDTVPQPNPQSPAVTMTYDTGVGGFDTTGSAQ